MESHQLLRDVLQKAGAKEVAAALGLSLSMVYKWAEPSSAGSGTPNPLDRIESLIKTTNDPRLVQWICEKAGGFYIDNPKETAPHPAYLMPITNRIIQEFADLIGVIAMAAADNQISREESKEIRIRWEELKSVTEGFVRCCEHGHFFPAKPAAASEPEKTSK